MKPIDLPGGRPCRSGEHLVPQGVRQCARCRDLAADRRALGGPRRKWEHRARQTPEEKRTQHNLYSKLWHAAHPVAPEVVRDRNLRHNYDTTLESWNRLYAAQDGKCRLCRRPLGIDAVIDHDHRTGAIRGIDHRACNRAIGIFDDDPAVAVKCFQEYADLAAQGWADKIAKAIPSSTDACHLCGEPAIGLIWDGAPAPRPNCLACLKKLSGGAW